MTAAANVGRVDYGSFDFIILGAGVMTSTAYMYI
jgi:hypothetical protein